MPRKILAVDDDALMRRSLAFNLERSGFSVQTAGSAEDALEMARQTHPDLMIMDIGLPGMDGLEALRKLRDEMGIPVILLTARRRELDEVLGLELGADDYITKPFDIEELKLRVQNAIARSERESLTDPQSGLPSGRLIEDFLRKIIRKGGWAFLDIQIKNFEAFKDVYGFIAANDLLRFTGKLLGEVIDAQNRPDDFVGHAGGSNFVVITSEEAALPIQQNLKARFKEESGSHYNFMDREQGFVQTPGVNGEVQKTPLMILAIGMVSPSSHEFSDIREITELAADERRKDTGI